VPGPNLPKPHEPFTVDAFSHRWPTGAEKVELFDGVPLFYGDFDHRDVEAAQRAYPGRRVLLNESGGIEIHPASDDPSQTLYQAYLAQHEA
jgi:hypothetical protein